MSLKQIQQIMSELLIYPYLCKGQLKLFGLVETVLHLFYMWVNLVLVQQVILILEYLDILMLDLNAEQSASHLQQLHFYWQVALQMFV